MFKVIFHYVFVHSIFEIQTYSSFFGFPKKTCTPFSFDYEKKWIHRFIGAIDVWGYILSIASENDCVCLQWVFRKIHWFIWEIDIWGCISSIARGRDCACAAMRIEQIHEFIREIDIWGCILSIAREKDCVCLQWDHVLLERKCVREIKKLVVKRWIQEKAWNRRRWRMT